MTPETACTCSVVVLTSWVWWLGRDGRSWPGQAGHWGGSTGPVVSRTHSPRAHSSGASWDCGCLHQPPPAASQWQLASWHHDTQCDIM